MEVLEPRESVEFSRERQVARRLSTTARTSVTVVGWEPGQMSSIHAHPEADEPYHVLDGEGLFEDGRQAVRLGPGSVVVFPAGEVHRVRALTRLVLCRVQAGTNRRRVELDGWPARRDP